MTPGASVALLIAQSLVEPETPWASFDPDLADTLAECADDIRPGLNWVEFSGSLGGRYWVVSLGAPYSAAQELRAWVLATQLRTDTSPAR